MTVAARIIEKAQQLHQAGRWQEAERLYLQALDRSPGESNGLHLLGLLHAETGREETAAQLLSAAIGIEGPSPHLCRNLGIILERQGKPEAAVACYRQALSMQPGAPDVWSRLAELLCGLGRFGDAAQAWRRAVETSPEPVEAQIPWRLAWAKSLALAGDRESAKELLQRILRVEPSHVDARYDLGVILMQLDQAEAAITEFEQVVAAAPHHGEAHNNLGLLLHSMGDPARARQHYAAALSANPDSTPARYNLGTLLQEIGEIDLAAAEQRHVLELDPAHAGAWTNLSNCLLSLGDPEAARECAEQALRLAPGQPSARWNAGLADLTAGRLRDGWPGYEARFELPGGARRRPVRMPLWKGEPLAGKSILVYAEQGLGDTLHFCRYLAKLSGLGARVVFECPGRLAPLLETLDPRPELVEAPCKAGPRNRLSRPAAQPARTVRDELGLHTCRARLPDRHPGRPGPLAAAIEPSATAPSGWVRFAGKPQVQERPQPEHSLPGMDPLRSVPGLSLVHLQFGVEAPADLVDLDLGPAVGDFADTAGLIEELDLVITVDTSMVHLAGALGKQTWLLLPYAADWRWLRDRSDSPWYPSVRIFRQPRPDDWASVMHEVAAELRHTMDSCHP
jgi:tetratricopeptide (TPR) repeat protein